MEKIDTIYGCFIDGSQSRLELTFDYENGAINSFKNIASLIEAEIFLDVGSNIGAYSVFISQVKSIKKIHAFEPAPNAFSMMEKNFSIQKNNEKFHAYSIAASSARGKLKFKIISPISGANSVLMNSATDEDVIDVESRPIDEIVLDKNMKSMVKIDVEGHELQVVEGMRNFLRMNECYVQIESGSALIKQLIVLMNSLEYRRVFYFNNDHIFIKSSMSYLYEPMIDLFANNLSDEIKSLRQLRREKRKNSSNAKRLWKSLSYDRNPIFKT